MTGISPNLMVRRAQAGRATWGLVHLQTRQLRTATPGLAVVRHDVLAIRDLCKQVLPIDVEARGEIGTAGAHDVRALVNGSIRAFSDVARWNGVVFDDLNHSGQLLVPSRTLTGSQVSDDPRLVAAKLSMRVTPASAERIIQLAATYRTAGSQQIDGLGRTCDHTAGAFPRTPTVSRG